MHDRGRHTPFSTAAVARTPLPKITHALWVRASGGRYPEVSYTVPAANNCFHSGCIPLEAESCSRSRKGVAALMEFFSTASLPGAMSQRSVGSAVPLLRGHTAPALRLYQLVFLRLEAQTASVEKNSCGTVRPFSTECARLAVLARTKKQRTL
ncbi:hypothetical protein NDU88_000494 [Pleurodeles waltl]|uniref:Uncharacterized protein n=1 Tax=Pleurodeles waltl TaxID=8319 RepID=A0AAV7VYL2_PLEWA|nr:hypothetical protein NDU88_000494 [Pleurodeles waltl]